MSLPKNFKPFIFSFIFSFVLLSWLLVFGSSTVKAAGWIWGSDPSDPTQFVIRDTNNSVKFRIDSTGLTTTNLQSSTGGGVGDSNLVANGGFENDTTGTGFPDGWLKPFENTGAGGTALLDSTATIVYGGAKILKLITVASGDGVSIASSPFPVNPGKTYTASVDVNGNFGSGFYLRILFYPSDGTTLRGDASSIVDVFGNAATTGSWVNRSGDFLVPAGNGCASGTKPCTRARLALYHWVSTSGTRYFDNAKVVLSGVSNPVPAAIVSAGTFGSSVGNGNFSFPARVGIGTAGPNQQLEVNGNVTLSGLGNYYGLNNRTDLGLFGNGNYSLTLAAPEGIIMNFDSNANGTSTPFQIQEQGNPLVTVLENGNVGIGLTGPNRKLHVTGGDVRLQSSNLYFNDNRDTWGIRERMTDYGDGMGLDIDTSDGAGTYGSAITIRHSSGNRRVGIGTTGPGQKLDVQGGNINTSGNLIAYGIQGNGNVGGTGSAAWFPSGIYTPGTNWIYGTTYTFNGTWYDVNNQAYYVDPASTSIYNDLRANIFYDNNDTTYYLDPNSTGAAANLNGNIRIKNATGKGLSFDYSSWTDNAHIWLANTFDLKVAGHSTVNFYTNHLNVGDAGLRGYFDNNGFTVVGNLYSPIMYDSNDTGYYVDPNSYSNVWMLNRQRGYNSVEYDYNDTAYYVDPNGSSRFNDLRGNVFYYGADTSYRWEPGGSWNTFRTPSGYISLGPANGSWAHIYSDKNFYMNQNLYLYGNRVYADNYRPYADNAGALGGIGAASFRQFNTWQNNHYSGTDGAEYATIFYDTNNSGFYVDPNSTSVLNHLRVDQGGNQGQWTHDPYGYGWGAPAGSFRNLEVSSSGNFSTEPAMLRIHQWGSGAAEFWKPQGTILYLRETPGGGGGWFTQLQMQNNLAVTGNVGIGTVSPGYKLEVNGNIGTGSTIYAGSGIHAGTVIMNWPGYGGHIRMSYGNYVFPGSNSGLGDWQGSYYLASSASWGLYTNTSMYFAGGVYSPDRVQVPIFYDWNDTGYYVDPNSYSNMWMVNRQRGYNSVEYDYNDTAYYVDPNGSSRFNYMGRNYGFNWTEYDWNDTGYYVDPNQTSLFNDLRANIFYDRQDTTYRMDPNGESRMYGFYYINYAYIVDVRPQYMYDWNDSAYYIDMNNTSRLNYLGRNYGWNWTEYDWNDTSYYMDLNQVSELNQIRFRFAYDKDDTGYYLDPNGTSNINYVTDRTKSRLGLTGQYNTPRSDYTGDSGYWTGAMGWGTTDFNTIFSNWGSGFFDTWSWPGNRPNDSSSHWEGMQGMHYSYRNSYNVYGWQMAMAGEANNRFFWRSSWNTPRAWVEMIHSGNIGSQTVSNSDMVDGYHESAFVRKDTWWSSTYYGGNGDIYLGFWGKWLSTDLSQRATHRGEGTNFIDYAYGLYDAYRGGWRTSNDLYVSYSYNSAWSDRTYWIYNRYWGDYNRFYAYYNRLYMEQWGNAVWVYGADYANDVNCGRAVCWNTWNGSYLGTNGDLYMNWDGRWLSQTINQDVRSGSSPTFGDFYSYGTFWAESYGAVLRYVYSDRIQIQRYQSRPGWLGTGCWNDVWTRYTVDNCGYYHAFAVGAFYQSGQSDLAEVTPVDPSENLIIGEIVSLDPAQNVGLHRTKGSYEHTIAGIVSNRQTAGMTIGGDTGPENIDFAKDKRPIALVGRVTTIVNLQNGPIKTGDPITSSDTPGQSMKATKAGTIVSNAMESFDGTRINSPGVEKVIAEVRKEMATLSPDSIDIPKYQKTIDELTRPLPSGSGRILTWINLSYYDPDIYLTSTDDLKIVGDNGEYKLFGKNNSPITKIGAFAELIVAKIQAGYIETKKLVVDGVDILKKLNELSDKSDKQQQTIESQKKLLEEQQKAGDSQQKQIEELKKTVEELKK